MVRPVSAVRFREGARRGARTQPIGKPNAAGCEESEVRVWGQAGANPPSGSIWRRSSVVEQAAHNRCVGGSNPPAATRAVAPRTSGATKQEVGFHNMRSAWRYAMA